MNARGSTALRAERAGQSVAVVDDIRLDRSLRSAILGAMGVTTWLFLRPRPGELQPLALSKVEDFFFGTGQLPVDEEGLVRYAEVIVHLEDRRDVSSCSDGTIGPRTPVRVRVNDELVLNPRLATKTDPL